MAGPTPLARPYVLLSCAISLDGYLDDAGEQRLLLSDAEDFDQVDELRAAADAILVGAGTVRRDDPRLLVRSPARRAARVARGLPPSPLRVTVTGTAALDPAARFFTVGDTERVVYCGSGAFEVARRRLAGTAGELVRGAEPLDLGEVLQDLGRRGVGRVLVEGGRGVLSGLLAAELADELRLAVAPVLVADARAPRLVADGAYPWQAGRRARLVATTAAGDVAVLRYALSDRWRPAPSLSDRRQPGAPSPDGSDSPVSGPASHDR